MESGIARKVDRFGRLVIPRELLDRVNMNIGDMVDFMLLEGDIIGLKKTTAPTLDNALKVLKSSVAECKDEEKARWEDVIKLAEQLKAQHNKENA